MVKQKRKTIAETELNLEKETEFPDINISEQNDSDNEELHESDADLTDVPSDSEYEDFEEKRVKVIRKKLLPEINPVYEEDSSDEEVENTIGNVPIEWYNDYPHIGYDVNGKKVMRPAQGDDLDKFLDSIDNKDAWKSVHDKLHGKDVKLDKKELEMLKRIQEHQFPDVEFDPYQPTVEWFTSKVETMPLSGAHEPKRRFIPSKHEAAKIMKIARAIRAGLIVPGKKKPESSKPKFYDIWENTDGDSLKQNHIPAPKMALPEHMESYNPPEEYLLTKEEEKQWKSLDPEDRPHNFLPKKHSSLRETGAYNRFIQERFERCLDLYLCPRTVKQKIDIDPESLIPKLPSPKDLKPFPTKLAITYKGHQGRIRTFSVDPTGQWLASGGDDSTVRIWEISTGRNIKTLEFSDAIMCVSWNPNKSLSLLAVACENQVTLVNASVASDEIIERTSSIITELWGHVDNSANIKWEKPSADLQEAGHCCHIRISKKIMNLTWHRKGDYFATVTPEANAGSVQIHQLSKASSQNPFKKSKGLVQKVIFHPSKPFLFVATQRSVRVYNLIKQELIRKLLPGVKWISSIDIHPSGDNVIIGTYDKRTQWFDMDLSAKPYKTLRYHKEAVRQVSFHKRYPLFASASDDGSVLIFHGMVYNDLMQNPLIVPLKTINAHERVDSLGVLDCAWHPTQPWLFSCGADKTIKLFI